MSTPTDVNERMFTERRATIERGGATRRDDGTWVYADKSEVFGREGLDMTSGEAALYTTTPAWHGLGTVIPGGISDVDEVLRLAHIGWEVSLRPTRYLWHGGLRVVEDKFVTVREDTGAALGVVGKVYHPMQNRASFAFLQDLVANFGVVFESAGALRGGRRTFVSLRLPDTVMVDAEGINDEIIPFVAALNSHDGSTPFTVAVTPWRPVCANTERFAVRDAYTKWTVRHTATASDRMEEARRSLGLSHRYYEQFAAEETLLARTDATIDEVRTLLDELWPVKDDAPTLTRQRGDERGDTVVGLFEKESARVGSTAYAAERAVTDYVDHYATIRPSGALKGNELGARGARLLDGVDDEVKDKAHRKLMLLVRR
ncbi:MULTISPECIES: DUF932 domain-containing protein [unclassified Frankia]|uniref:DUF932 domain-containing protein n=1 Tax=unclassified Frankia TaxID=2632575 RepID=UPI002AD4BC7A|nr:MULTISPECIES: DUF932 domain-containing protein [unclassified Frankia]